MCSQTWLHGETSQTSPFSLEKKLQYFLLFSKGYMYPLLPLNLLPLRPRLFFCPYLYVYSPD